MTAEADTLTELAQLLANVGQRITELARALDELPTRRTVDMLAVDPLAAFRTASGHVAYVTGYADEVVVGDWVQRCHGDPGWHLVEDQEDYPGPDGTPWVRLTYRGTAHDWKGTDAIRCARPPADTVAAQEQRWT